MSNPAESKYPWDEWFSSATVSLKKGMHFRCQVHGMAQQIRNAARRRGLRVSLEIAAPHIHVRVVGRSLRKKARAKR